MALIAGQYGTHKKAQLPIGNGNCVPAASKSAANSLQYGRSDGRPSGVSETRAKCLASRRKNRRHVHNVMDREPSQYGQLTARENELNTM